MDFVTLSVIVIAVSVAVLVYVLVPMVLQLRRTLKTTEDVLRETNGSLKKLIEEELSPMISIATENLGEMKEVIAGAKDGVEKIDETLESVRKVGETVQSVNELLKHNVKDTVIDIAAYLVGLKTGIETFINTYKRFRHKEVE